MVWVWLQRDNLVLDAALSLEPVPGRPYEEEMTMHDLKVEPRLAASILLVRDHPEFQVLMVKRHHQIDFVSRALVFPGGKTHAGDADPEWEGHASG